MTDTSLAVVIPTRNRAHLAISAIESLLADANEKLSVVVSDNSAIEHEVTRLSSFCRSVADPRLTYVRPPELLSQPAHWNWAISQAMERTAATHLSVHYDRKLTKRGSFRRMMRVAAEHPRLLITFPSDSVVDEPPAFVVWQVPSTGRLYEMTSARVVELSAKCLIGSMGQALPILSNCIVPRIVFDAIRARFGNYCDSHAPDSSFLFRFCALNERFLHADNAAGIYHAWHRSAGRGYMRHAGGDFGDFLNAWGDRRWITEVPLPDVCLGQNILYHEYSLVRREVDWFPPLDMNGYLNDLGEGLASVSEPAVREELHALLEAHGWTPQQQQTERPEPPFIRKLRPSHVAEFIRVRWLNHISGDTLVKGYRLLGLRPGSISGLQFPSEQTAIAAALAYPRKRERRNETIEELQPVDLGRLPAAPD